MQHQLIFKNNYMKKAKNDATSFKQLDAAQMRKVDGGTWVNISNPDGTVTPVWV